jgi:hypothetical protein
MKATDKTKLVLDKDIQSLISSYTDNYELFVDDYDTSRAFSEHLGEWEPNHPASQIFIDKDLPNRAKLVKLVLANKAFKENVEAAAVEIADQLIECFSVAKDDYEAAEIDRKAQEEADREEDERLAREEREYEEEQAKKNAAKQKLMQTLSPEQRKAVNEVLGIAI